MEEEILKAKKKAMSLLQHMDRTEWELRSKLEKAGFAEEAVREAVEYVRSFHYIDDRRYALRFVEIYCESRSIQRIRQDLQKKHISDDLITLAFEEIEYNDSRALEKAMDKVLSGKDGELSYEERQKIIAKLYRKGFPVEQIVTQLEKRRMSF
ncbi:MAG: recombination regulator RecX [Lachnospiraceae bacterium]|nr:recombination regulator RecX [Lachnospiraceae bacterium]